MKQSYRKTIRKLTRMIKNQENLKRIYKLAVYLWMNEGGEKR